MNRNTIENDQFFARFRVSQWAGELRHTLKIWPLRGFFALLDQGLISGSNFVIAILLGRWLAPQQYGSYALAFEVFLFMSIVYASLILEPMSVFGPSLYKNDFNAYLGILLRIHCALSILMMVVVFALAGILNALKPPSTLPTALVGVGVACPCLLLFWLARRGFYVNLLPQKAALSACAYSAVVLAGVMVVYKVRSLSALSAFLMMAAGAITTGPLMLHWFKSHIPSSPGRVFRIKDIVWQHWNYGRWALASAMAIWFSGAVYYPMLGSFFTLAETGKFKALMNLSSPIGQAYVALSILTLPFASRAHHEHGDAAVRRMVWKLTGFYLLGSVLYWLVVVLGRGPIVHHLYGGKYTQVIALLPWVALGSTLRIGATAQANVLRAMRSPARVFTAYSAGSVVAFLLGVPLTQWLGLRGAVFAWVLSGAACFIGTVVMIQRKPTQPRAAVQPSRDVLVLQGEATMSIQR